MKENTTLELQISRIIYFYFSSQELQNYQFDKSKPPKNFISSTEFLAMGLCTSKSTVTLDPSAHTLNIDRASHNAGEGVSFEGIPVLGDGVLMVQPVKTKTENVARGGGVGPKIGGALNQPAKDYLELGGKGGGEGEAQTSLEAEEEDEDEEGDRVEELINFSNSEGSLRSEFLE